VLLNDVARVSAEVASVPGRRAKIDLIADLLGACTARLRHDASSARLRHDASSARLRHDGSSAPRRPDQTDQADGPDGGADGSEVTMVVAFLSGELRQRQIGVGYAALTDLLSPRAGAAGPVPQSSVPAAAPTLTVAETDQVFAAIGQVTGAGSQAERRRLLAELFGRATEEERSFLVQLVVGELRQGALEGVMIEAVARAAEVPAAEVRRALLVGGSLPAVARAALCGTADPLTPPSPGEPGSLGKQTSADAAPSGNGQAAVRRLDALTALRSFALRVGRPLRPMLAAAAPSIVAAMEKVSPAGVEWKIDGIRVQVHKDGDLVTVFTRTLDDITTRVPEIAEAVRAVPAQAAVLDGEAVALFPDGRARPFQVTASRTGSQIEVDALRGDVPLTTFFFDLLHLDGEDLIDAPAHQRHDALARLLPTGLVVPRTVTEDPQAAQAFFDDAVARGHEGVVLKSLDAPYATGRRGSEWIKVKPRHTLDLVILAAEWGHGRRRGWLSNLHLGARDPATGGLVMLGKTFKGLTDQMLTWQTGRLLELADSPRARPSGDPKDAHGVVRVRPELVVEIAFDGVQVSRRYPGGLALRFARVIRYRPDKTAAEADTIDAVRAVAPVTEPE
jgi:DNA ligase-1